MNLVQSGLDRLSLSIIALPIVDSFLRGELENPGHKIRRDFLLLGQKTDVSRRKRDLDQENRADRKNKTKQEDFLAGKKWPINLLSTVCPKRCLSSLAIQPACLHVTVNFSFKTLPSFLS